MGHTAGYGGSVSAGALVAGIKSWTLDYTVDMLDTTDFGSSGDKEYIAGLKGWSGTFDGNKDGLAQALGASVTLTLTETASVNWQGKAFLTGLAINTAVDGLVGYSYTYMGTGSITVASA